MTRPRLAALAALALLALACRSIDAPAPRTPVPTPEVTRTAVPRGTAAATPTAAGTPRQLLVPQGAISARDLPEFPDATGKPHSGRSLIDFFGDAGLDVGGAGGGPRLSVCQTGPSSFSLGGYTPRFTTHTIAVGRDGTSAVLGLIIYIDTETLREDWVIETDGSASIREDGVCAALAVGTLSGSETSATFASFFFGGFDEAGAIGHGNLIVTFANAVFGDISVGGNGLDPELRAEVERLIRGLHEE